ncbi:hypothetical protein [Fontivita pretiosa]|uniref:hypothetical protein n=1 Tax=Fontivita pretiosa TaxID=2989684 RepID=UPI003D164091
MRSEANDQLDALDRATAQRLGKLRTMPVDTSRLDRLIQAQIPRTGTSRTTAGHQTFWLLLRQVITPVRAVAASVAVLATVGVIVWSLSGSAVLASPDTMAKFHEDLVSGRIQATQVDSIAQANRVLAAEWNRRQIEIPNIPSEHVMLCCMQSIDDKQVACVLLKSEGGVPITMAVARSADMKMPRGSARVIRNGVTYHVQSSGNLNMVMTERGGRYICLIGAVARDSLISIAEGIHF